MTRRGLPVGPPPEELLDLLAPESQLAYPRGLAPESQPAYPRGQIDPVAEESPFLRPRRRTRVRPRRRGFTARALLLVQVVAVGLVGVVGAWTAWQKVFASDRLRVGRLEVRGSHFLSEGEVRELIGPAVGERILALDIEALKARLRASPWVADATITRALPLEKGEAWSNCGLMTISPVLAMYPHWLLFNTGASPSEKGIASSNCASITTFPVLSI